MINPDELIYVVDEENNPAVPLARREVHERGLWHRVAHIWVVNREGMILCQRRSILKDHSPGMMEAYFGGHLEANVENEDGAVRELEEELGIGAHRDDLHYFTVYKSRSQNEFQAIYVYFWEGDLPDLKLEEDEVESVDLYELEELEEIFARTDEDWVLQGNEHDVLDFIKSKMKANRES